MLALAIDLARDHIANEPDGFTDEDTAALDELRQLPDADRIRAEQTRPSPDGCSRRPPRNGRSAGPRRSGASTPRGPR